MAITAIAISFFIIIIAVAVSSGFRTQIRDGVATIMGDVQLNGLGMNYFTEDSPYCLDSLDFDEIKALKGVKTLTPVIYRAGIVKNGEDIQGVLIKGVQTSDTTSLGVKIPTRLSSKMGLKPGDNMLTYFVGEKVKVRKFKVTEIYEDIIDTDDNLLVFASIDDLRRLNNWQENEVSAVEISLENAYRGREIQRGKAAEISLYSSGIATSAQDRYSNLFDWLNLLDFNVVAVLMLMIAVAGFNMISALLILLFRNIPTIGTLKALGMTNTGVSGVFLRVAGRTVLQGMLIGNVLALLFCLIQGTTHLLKLNPENYFVSFVPVHLNLPYLIVAEVLAFVLIMLFLLIPCLFISKIDPADTVRVR